MVFATIMSLSATTTASQAATFTVGGTDYDVTTVTGTFDANRSLLMSQLWWGNGTLASSFATEVKFSLGNDPTVSSLGAVFAYGVDAGTFEKAYGQAWRNSPPNSTPFWTADTAFATRLYAVATVIPAVPLPAGGVLLLSGLAGMAALRRRKKQTT